MPFIPKQVELQNIKGFLSARERQPRASNDRFFFLVALSITTIYPKSTPTHLEPLNHTSHKNSQRISIEFQKKIRRALMWLKLHGREAVQHKVFCVFGYF